jgi:osmotically inducible protein OsmC
MSTSKASAQWKGSLKEGQGSMKPEHGPEVPFSQATRFEGARGSNPEELVGAALAGCFSMALGAALGKAGLSPRSIETQAEVELGKEAAGFKIARIVLLTTAAVQGADATKFLSIAEETKKTCPVSKALAGTEITLKATLTQQ